VSFPPLLRHVFPPLTRPSPFLRILQVWNPDGDLLGKIFLGTGSANLAFAGDAGLIILAETKIFLAKFGATAPDLWSY